MKLVRLMTALAVLLTGFCTTGVWAETQKKDRIVVIMKSPPRHLNNALTSSTQTIQIATQIFASPLRYDENWNPQPYLAKSWRFSEDFTSLTLNLVENATFHDGAPVTSEDVAFSIMMIKKNHPFKAMFEPVTRVDAPDAKTAIIRLSRPHPALLLSLSPPLCPILPKHVYGDGQELKTHPANMVPVGSGPFKVQEHKVGEYVILKKNGNFFIPNRPILNEIVFRFIKDPSSRMMSIDQGDAQIFPLMANTRNVRRLEKNDKLEITEKGYEAIGAQNWLEFNVLKDQLKDVRVRKAISYAVDKEFIVSKLHSGLSTVSTGPMVPASPYYEENVEKYRVNLDKAKSLLDEAGYPVGDDGMRFSLSMDFEPGLPEQQKLVAEYLKSQLKKVGIDIQLRSSPDWSTWAERVSNWTHDLTMVVTFGWGDPVIGIHRTYISSNIKKGLAYGNMTNYNNSEVDELLEAASVEQDEAKRTELYKKMQRIVTSDAPICYINIIPYYTVFNKDVSNIVSSIWGPLAPMDTVSWR